MTVVCKFPKSVVFLLTIMKAIYHTMSDPIGSYHTYTIDWTAESIKWSIDGNLVRTLTYGDALALGGKNYPQVCAFSTSRFPKSHILTSLIDPDESQDGQLGWLS
jgi:hypothetical protein